jgi:hypothetical protein
MPIKNMKGREMGAGCSHDQKPEVVEIAIVAAHVKLRCNNHGAILNEERSNNNSLVRTQTCLFF